MLVRLITWWFVLGAVVACASAAPSAPFPTLTLVEATPTLATAPLSVSPTLVLMRSDVLATPTLVAPEPILASSAPVDENLLRLFVQDLARLLSINAERIQFIDARRTRWDNPQAVCDRSFDVVAAEGSQEGLRVRLLVGNEQYIYFALDGSQFGRCPTPLPVVDDLLLVVDPLANELVGIARNRVATESVVPVEDVELTSVEARIWQDQSLGCPRDAEATYQPIIVLGYRIVLSMQGREYTFHTDTVSLVRCDP